jgi:peroxiredoxin Q/BCP
MENNKVSQGMGAPEFCLDDSYNKKVCLKAYRGKNVVLYFYPKDNTPGCTMEGLDFSRLKDKFSNADAVILGISKDSCESHQKFIDKHGLTITLLSDPDSAVQKKYGVWRMKKFMGREFMGTVRSTVLVDPKGKVTHVWDKVKVKGHAEDVLKKLKETK